MIPETNHTLTTKLKKWATKWLLITSGLFVVKIKHKYGHSFQFGTNQERKWLVGFRSSKTHCIEATQTSSDFNFLKTISTHIRLWCIGQGTVDDKRARVFLRCLVGFKIAKETLIVTWSFLPALQDRKEVFVHVRRVTRTAIVTVYLERLTKGALIWKSQWIEKESCLNLQLISDKKENKSEEWNCYELRSNWILPTQRTPLHLTRNSLENMKTYKTLINSTRTH